MTYSDAPREPRPATTVATLVLRVRDRRADRALFLFLHRFVKFLELLLFARQVFGEGGVIKVCDVGMDRFHQPQKALILDQLAEALAKRRNTISGRAFGNEHAAPEVEHDVDAGLTAGRDIRQACPALRVGHAQALELPAPQ